MRIELIGLDGDDTLWHNQPNYDFTQRLFCELVRRHVPDALADQRLLEIEERNMRLFGYGIKAFTLSMIETAIEITGGRIPASDLLEIIAAGKRMYERPIELLDGTAEAVAALQKVAPVVIITKGDLLDQESKVARSGLAEMTHAVEVVATKDPDSYRRVLGRHGIDPGGFVMVGDSLRSDIEPVLAVGGTAVHVPYAQPWAHELRHDVDTEHPGYHRVDTLGAVPPLLRRLSAGVVIAS